MTPLHLIRRSLYYVVLTSIMFAIGSGAHVWAGSPEFPIKGYYSNGKMQFELTPSPDGKDVIYRKYDASGELTFERKMLEGSVQSKEKGLTCSGNDHDGVVRCEDEKYQMIYYTPYRGGQINGQVRMVSGHSTRFIQYRDGKKDGESKEITHYAGESKTKGRTYERVSHYRQDKLNGREVATENGTVKSLATWNNGILDGPCMERTEYSEKKGQCHGMDMYSGFTGTEKRYGFDYDEKKKSKKAKSSTESKPPRHLEAIVEYKDGKVVKETKTARSKQKYGGTSSQSAGAVDESKEKQLREWRKSIYSKLDQVLQAPKDLPEATVHIQKKVRREEATKAFYNENITYYARFITGFVSDDRHKALGLQRGDIVVALNGEELDMRDAYGWSCPEKENKCTVRIFRDGKFIDLVMMMDTIKTEKSEKKPEKTDAALSVPGAGGLTPLQIGDAVVAATCKRVTKCDPKKSESEICASGAGKNIAGNLKDKAKAITQAQLTTCVDAIGKALCKQILESSNPPKGCDFLN